MNPFLPFTTGSNNRPPLSLTRYVARSRQWLFYLGLLLFLAGCAPSDEMNVLGYLIERQLGGPVPASTATPATLTGQVLYAGEPVADVAVVVAERTGTPHVDYTNEEGRYRIKGIPPGQYVPAAVGPGFDEVALSGAFDIPRLVTLPPGETVEAPPLHLPHHDPEPLPAPLPDAVDLEAGAAYTVTAPFPAGAIAVAQPFTFTRESGAVDTLRVYRPPERDPSTLPLIFALYPGDVGGWQTVSTAFAHAGYVVVALSPVGARGLDVDAHAQDARLALALARGGHLGVADLADAPAVTLGGSFTSAVLYRLLRDEGHQFNAWVTVGGISNAFTLSAAFYGGELVVPERYRFAIPALGPANLYPEPFLRYSPVYTAAQLPPTLIIHTDADRIFPIEQAYELEEALRTAGVPVDVFYYEDVSHYLQIGEDLTPAGQEMYERVIDFVERYTDADSP